MSTDAQIAFNLVCADQEMSYIISSLNKKRDKNLKRRLEGVKSILSDMGKILLNSSEFKAYLENNPYFKAKLADL